MQIDRRTLLVGVGAAALSSGLATPAAAVAPLPPPATFPVWTVGTPGEMNWRVIAAATQDAARKLWLEYESLDDADEDNVPELDVRATKESVIPPQDYEGEVEQISHADYEALGWDQTCFRCDYPTDPSNYRVFVPASAPPGAQLTIVVCHDCMRLEDWKIADPDVYANEIELARMEAEEREIRASSRPSHEHGGS